LPVTTIHKFILYIYSLNPQTFHMRSFALFMTFLFLVPFFTMAQWDHDPMINTEIKNSTDWETVAHIATGEDGKCYISWYSGTDEMNFNVYLQQLNTGGQKLMGGDGLLVSDHTTDSWVTDYSLIFDNLGNAVLATQDMRTGNSNVFVYKISPEGEFLWGPGGIQLSDNPDFNPFPKLLLAADGDIIVSWSRSPADTTLAQTVNLQKINPDGTLAWGEGITLADTLHYFQEKITLTSDGNLAVLWRSRLLPQNIYPGEEDWTHNQVQKFDMDGNALWDSSVQVDTGQLMMFLAYTDPVLMADEEGGVFVCWMSNNGFGNNTVYMQHLDASANLLYPDGPVEVCTNSAHEHVEPAWCKIESEEDLFIFWREIYYDDLNFRYCYSIFGQRMTPEGERIWGDWGLQFTDFICLDSNYVSYTPCPGEENDLLLVYMKEQLEINTPDTTVNDHIYAVRINKNGELIWDGERILIAATDWNKEPPDVGRLKNNQWIVVWAESRGETGTAADFGIYAQNITRDGNLGSLWVAETGRGSTGIRVCPNPVFDDAKVIMHMEDVADCRLELYSVDGHCVMTIFEGRLAAGAQELRFDAGTLPPGMYFLRAVNGEMTEVVKVLVMK
jgi:hypothetical protein